MSVRAAEFTDLAEILRIERSCETAPHWPGSEYERILAGEGAPRCLLLTEGGFAVGKVVAGEGELETVAVAPGERRRGSGRELCEAVIAWCRENGARAVLLEVRASSAGAQKLYEGLGFVQTGRRAGYYTDPDDDALLLRYEYNNAANARGSEAPQQRF